MNVPSPPSPPRPKYSLPTSLIPLRHVTFRMLWSTWLAANLCMWMNDVAAAWMMTTLTREPFWVALVQTASALPVFLFGLPSGALADIIDRRRYFIATQFWIACVALGICAAILAGGMRPSFLLALTFANGIGLAMRWPVFAAIVPELVPRAELPAALGLNGIAMNISRITGPLLAGAIIAFAGTAYVFVLNALLSMIAGVVIMRWRRVSTPSPLGREPFGSAMRVGVQFVRQSAGVKAGLARVSVFFFHSTALLALLPLVAHDLSPESGAATFTKLLACMGAGAIAAILALPRLRQHLHSNVLVRYGALTHAAMTAVIALTNDLHITMAAMALSGVAWITTANSLSVSVQMALPDWVRARGMAIYQMALMGGSAAGAAAWGNLATDGGIKQSLIFAALSGSLCMPVIMYLVRERDTPGETTPAKARPVPDAGRTLGHERLIVNIAYRIAPAHAAPFKQLMLESRRSRLGQGALSWELLEDINEPGLFIEQIVDACWIEHLRRFDRFTEADDALKERKLAFHIGNAPPLVTRRVVVAT